jgi:hypothetical protein
MKKFFIIFILFGVSFVYGADVFNRAQPRSFSMADPLQPDATIGGYPIWQNEKKWRIWNIARRDSGGSAQTVPLGDLHLFQTDGGKFVATMSITVNLAQGGAVGWSDEPCKREDVLFKASFGSDFWNENCVSINHITGFPGNPSGRGAELNTLFRESGVDIPPTVIRLTFSRTGPNLRMYRIVLNINPELAGIARESEVNWGRNSWHKSAYSSDPAKKLFIDALIRWSTDFSKQVELAYQKKENAFNSTQPWRTIFETPSLAKPTRPKVSLD